MKKSKKTYKKWHREWRWFLILTILLVNFGWIASNFSSSWIVRAEETAGEPGPTFAPWCSALYGIVEKELGQGPVGNSVPDIVVNGFTDASDLSALAAWYGAADNGLCHQQFENEGGYGFNCENYLQVDWCNGLKQGVIDSLGSSEGGDRYWYVYDLTADGYISASDLSYVAMYLGQGQDAQQECFDRFPFQLPPCSQCGNEIVEPGEECDYSAPIACETPEGYRGEKTCNMPLATRVEEISGQFCTWNPCVATEFCGDYVTNGPEECDDGPQGSELCTSDCRWIPQQVIEENSTSTASSGADSSVASQPNLENIVYTEEQSMAAEEVVEEVLPEPQISGIKISDTESEAETNWRNIGPIWWDQDVANQSVFPDGSLLRGWSSAIYHLENGQARHVQSLSELILSFFGQRIYNVQEWVLDLYR